MAAIQPKNTDDIRVNVIREKTAATGVTINRAIQVVDQGAVVPVDATTDLGTSTAAEHFQEAFVKEVTSNGQALALGTDSAHSIDLKTNATTRWSMESDGDLAQDTTNGGSILVTKQSTAVVAGVAATGLTAAGTTISDALALTCVFNNLTTVAASTGAKLWDAPLNTLIFVRNAGANALLLYPHSGSGTLNGGGAGSSVSIATGAMAMCWKVSSTNWIAIEFTVANA
jgi:hypothetical protein